jgi:hypothetical protein
MWLRDLILKHTADAFTELRAEIAAIDKEARREAPRARLEALERSMCELADLHGELHKSVVRLRSRAGMREARAKLNGEDTSDDAMLTQTQQLAALERKHGLRR